jgi:hypothetical protein
MHHELSMRIATNDGSSGKVIPFSGPTTCTIPFVHVLNQCEIPYSAALSSSAFFDSLIKHLEPVNVDLLWVCDPQWQSALGYKTEIPLSFKPKSHWASHFMNEMAVNKNTSGPSSILRTTCAYFIK